MQHFSYMIVTSEQNETRSFTLLIQFHTFLFSYSSRMSGMDLPVQISLHTKNYCSCNAFDKSVDTVRPFKDTS